VKHIVPIISARDDHSALPSSHSHETKPLAEALSRFEEKCGRARVLIVEDDFLVGQQTEEALTTAGLEVVGIAATAEEAVELAVQARPILAVMDIRLAGRRDGIDAAEELFQLRYLRCIFATANDDYNTRVRAAPFAPLGWLTKPYTMTSLLGAVALALAELR
jgi:two-component system, response regulator PdtaR